MNIININNYEAYLLDYLEGNLEEQLVSELRQFIVVHPELNIQLDELELMPIISTEELFENKNNLKKTLSDLISPDQFIEYIENISTENSKKQIDDLAALHPEVMKELNLYQKTILQPDTFIEFKNKKSLKKETKVLWLFNYTSLSIAASIVFIFGIWFLFKSYNAGTTDHVFTEKINFVENKLSDTNSISVHRLNNTLTHVEENTLTAINKTIKNNSHSKKQESKLVSSSKATFSSPVHSLSTSTVSVAKEIPLPISTEPKSTIKNSTETKTTPTYVIIEKAFDEDEILIASNSEKKGFWSKAKNALNSLNKLGLKTVNGEEENSKSSEQYLLSLGNLSIQNNKFLQE